jgi:hypothetical protein
MIEELIAQQDTRELSTVLADAYLSSVSEINQDVTLRHKVIERIAISPMPNDWRRESLGRFDIEEVAPIANKYLGRIESNITRSESYRWLIDHHQNLNSTVILKHFEEWNVMTPTQLEETIYLLYHIAPDEVLERLTEHESLYTTHFVGWGKDSPSETALTGLFGRTINHPIKGFSKIRYTRGCTAALLPIMKGLCNARGINHSFFWFADGVFQKAINGHMPRPVSSWPEFSATAKKLVERLSKRKDYKRERKLIINTLNLWAHKLDTVIAEKEKKKAAVIAKTKLVPAKSVKKQATKKALNKKPASKKSASKKSSKINEGESKA